MKKYYLISFIVSFFYSSSQALATEKIEVNSNTIKDQDTGIDVTRFYLDNLNMHGSYVNSGMYTNNGFIFTADYGGSPSLYEYKDEEISFIDKTDGSIYDTANFFGLSVKIIT